MNRVLIVAGERQIGEHFQEVLSQEGFHTAVVWNPIQMVEFCRQHSPDFLIVDLNLADLGLWSAVQAVRAIGALSTVRFIGIASVANEHLFEKAKMAGFLFVLPVHGSSFEILEILRREISLVTSLEEKIVFSRDPSLNRLRELACDIVQIAASLKPRVSEYGDDGPELFDYIVNSGQEIRKKVNGVTDFSLHDRELRHDFRNMIGSVTGFSELILMEPDLSAESTQGLTRLRRNSKEFVDILDSQKAEATA